MAANAVEEAGEPAGSQEGTVAAESDVAGEGNLAGMDVGMVGAGEEEETGPRLEVDAEAVTAAFKEFDATPYHCA